MKVLVLNGPNLGRLGRRQPEIYGTTTHADLVALCQEWGAPLGLEVEVRQSNHEGVMLDWLNQAADDATPVVLNAAAWTHFSLALYDACAQLVALAWTAGARRLHAATDADNRASQRVLARNGFASADGRSHWLERP